MVPASYMINPRNPCFNTTQTNRFIYRSAFVKFDAFLPNRYVFVEDGRVSAFQTTFSGNPFAYLSFSAQRALSMIEPWIENGEPFILVGPEGCGKDMIIRYAFSGEGGPRGRSGGGGGKRVKTSTTVLHCNARTTAEHVITKASLQR